ncbi:Ig-like domain-containing protein [Bacillus sp. 1P10SD]|uniref:Ig-like domain-containing protein n=1 Tax=Bacillus sp. 1P10SD TaxID=3132265 RepID=UPI0039A50955
MSRILAYYRTPITNRLEAITCRYNQETGAYEATFEVSTNVEAGTYKFDHILVRDTSENDLLVWDKEALAKGEFHVYTENNPPVFTNLTVDKKVMELIEADQTIHLTLHATDDTHLQDAVVYYLSLITKTKIAVPLTLNGSTGSTVTGDFLIHSNTKAGSWKVDSIETKDMNDNITRVRADSVDLSSGQFTILPDQTEPEKPVVNEVTDRVTVVQGTTEPGATVDVVVNGDIISTGRAGSDKKFSITITTQKAGTVLTIIAVDWEGNKSDPTTVQVVRGKPGWSLENGYWYYYDPVTYVKKTGWYKVGSTWYFSNNDGVMQTGWIRYKGSWYYLKNSGAMATGWVNVNNKWYYLQIFGDMLTGRFFYNGHWYFLQPNGAMVTGSYRILGTTYYFDKNGSLR